MRPLLLAALLALALPAAAGAKTTKACDRAGDAARAALPDYASLTPYSSIGQTLCFDFTGDGRRDLVITRWLGMNHGAHEWAAYVHEGSRYVMVRHMADCCSGKPRYALGVGIRRRGTALEVSEPIFKKSDALCCPSGGLRIARWRWVDGALRVVYRKTTQNA
jgi:hypothetical protein